MAWAHLALADLLDDKLYSGDGSPLVIGESIPSSSIDNAGFWLTYSGTVYGKRDNVIGFGSDGNDTEDDVFGGAIPPTDAQQIDFKIDDGNPGEGNVFVTRGQPGSASTCTTQSAGGSLPSAYIERDQTSSCAVYFWLSNLD